MNNITILPARQLRAGSCFFCDRELSAIKIIIGLGNPGAKFAGSRHNIGFTILNELSTNLLFHFDTKHNFEQGNFIALDGRQIKFLKPQTFMNLSGQVLPHFLKGGLKAEQILVIHDELEKPLSNLAIKFSGSARGHNGLKSIIDFVGPNFWRLQFGVGRPTEKSDVSDFVLTKFAQGELASMQETVQRAVEYFSCNHKAL